MALTLSRRQVKEADRVGGIELMLPWPASLGPAPTTLAHDEEREATAQERRTAEAMVGASCAAHDLVPVHVRVACVQAPPDWGADWRVWLAVTIIGRRWVGARTTSQGRQMFMRSA